VYELAVFPRARTYGMPAERNHHQLRGFVTQAQRFQRACDIFLSGSIRSSARRLNGDG